MSQSWIILHWLTSPYLPHLSSSAPLFSQIRLWGWRRASLQVLMTLTTKYVHPLVCAGLLYPFSHPWDVWGLHWSVSWWEGSLHVQIISLSDCRLYSFSFAACVKHPRVPLLVGIFQRNRTNRCMKRLCMGSWLAWLWRLRNPMVCWLQAGDSEKLMVSFQSKTEDKGMDGISPHHKRTDVPAQAAGRRNPPLCFLFFLGPHWVRWWPPTLRRAIYSTGSTNSNANLLKKYPYTHTRYNVWFEHSMGQSRGHIKLTTSGLSGESFTSYLIAAPVPRCIYFMGKDAENLCWLSAWADFYSPP